MSAGITELIRAIRMADGLNAKTRRGEIGTSSPVLGLRLGRRSELHNNLWVSRDSSG